MHAPVRVSLFIFTGTNSAPFSIAQSSASSDFTTFVLVRVCWPRVLTATHSNHHEIRTRTRVSLTTKHNRWFMHTTQLFPDFGDKRVRCHIRAIEGEDQGLTLRKKRHQRLDFRFRWRRWRITNSAQYTLYAPVAMRTEAL